MAIQKDGKAVVAGSLLHAGGFAVARYNVDGTLDSGFGNGGLITTLFPKRNALVPALGVTAGATDERTDLSQFSAAFAVTIYPESDAENRGKILAGGCACQETVSPDYQSGERPAGLFGLVRYNTNGSIDTTFGDGGIVRTAFPTLAVLGGQKGPRAVISALAIYSSGENLGKVVAAGTAKDDQNRYFALARYNRDGSADLGFGNSGVVTTAFQPPGSNPAFAARSFADAYAVAIQPDGRIVAGGETGRFAVARYENDGSLERKSETQAGWARSIVFQGDGKVVLGGTGIRYGTSEQLLATVVRLQADTLALDPTFNPCPTGQTAGCGGATMVDFFAGLTSEPVERRSTGLSVTLAPGGQSKIVIAGASRVFESWTGTGGDVPVYRYGLALARLNPDGRLDDGGPQDQDPNESFGMQGKVLSSFGPGKTFISDVAMNPEGSIVAAGWLGRRLDYQFAVGRYGADGTAIGFETTRFPGGNRAVLESLKSQSNGEIIAAGTADGRFVVARYGADGYLDPEFNPCGPGESDVMLCNGIATPAFPASCPIDPAVVCTEVALAKALVIGGDGEIVAGGGAGKTQAEAAGLPDTAVLVRYEPGGALDPAFGEGGMVMLPTECAAAYVSDLAVSSDGTVTALVQHVICGGQTSNPKLTVVRLMANGRLDPEFNTCPPEQSVGCGGVAPVPAGSYGAGLVVQSNGDIVVGIQEEFSLIGFHSDGTLNQDFGDKLRSPGRIQTTYSRPGKMYSVTSHKAGSRKDYIVAVGQVGGVQGDPASGQATYFGVAQYTPNGTPDPDFNACLIDGGGVQDCDGKTTTPFGPPEYAGKAYAGARGVDVDPDGKIVAAGWVANSTVGESAGMFALARYTSDGLLDSRCYGFGQGGKVTTSFVQDAGANAVAVSDGKVVVGGWALAPRSNDQYRFALARYHGGSPKCGLTAHDASTVAEPVAGTVQATFPVSREGDPTLPATVDYTTVDGSARAGLDYTATSGKLVFGSGESTKSVTVDVLADAEVEGDETFSLRLSNPLNAELVDPEASATITNSSPTLDIGDAGAAEPPPGSPPAPATFTVTLSHAVPYPVSVSYGTANDSATAGSDFTEVSGTVTITAGATSAQVSVDVLGDESVEPQERFFLNVANPVSALMGDAQGRGTIADGGPGLRVTDAAVTEGNVAITPITFTVTAGGTPLQRVTVDYDTSDGTASGVSDYSPTRGVLVFEPQESSKTVTVNVMADTVDEEDESFSLVLSNPSGSFISVPRATGTIRDDDSPPIDEEPDDPPVELIPVVPPVLPQTPPPPPSPQPPVSSQPPPATPGPPTGPAAVAERLITPVSGPSPPAAPLAPLSQPISQSQVQQLTQQQAQSQAQSQLQQQVQQQLQSQVQTGLVAERHRERQVEGSFTDRRDAEPLLASARSRRAPVPAPAAAGWVAIMAAGAMFCGRRSVVHERLLPQRGQKRRHGDPRTSRTISSLSRKNWG